MDKTKFGNLNFHHFGLATKDPLGTKLFLEALGYNLINECYDDLQKVYLYFMIHDTMPNCEIVWSDKENNPLKSVLRFSNIAVYHICYEVENIDETILNIKKDFKLKIVSNKKPAILFNNRNVLFMYIENFGLIELVERI